MLFFFKLFILFFTFTNLQSSQFDYRDIFKKTLLDYNIVFESLGEYKAGAICIPKIPKTYEKYAVGFSYDMFERNFALETSLNGCKEMKKKLISYDCKCEIIYE